MSLEAQKSNEAKTMLNSSNFRDRRNARMPNFKKCMVTSRGTGAVSVQAQQLRLDTYLSF